MGKEQFVGKQAAVAMHECSRGFQNGSEKLCVSSQAMFDANQAPGVRYCDTNTII